MNYWQISEEWPGSRVYIIGGGPSVRDIDLEALRGEKIIAINSSCFAAPFADFCIFSDTQWWHHNRAQLQGWKGRIVCCSRMLSEPGLLMIRRKVPPALDQPNDCLGIQFTTATGAIELAVRLGAKQIVLLGIDGCKSADGKSHHHKPHPWPQGNDWQNRHRLDLTKMRTPLKLRGIDVRLGTPSVYVDLWPRVELPLLKTAA